MLRLVGRRAVTGGAGGRWEKRVGFSSSTAAAASRRRLEGKVALITGGASGLGKATAQEFIKEGATVVIADINRQLGLNSAQELGPKAQFIECDVAVERQVADAVDFAVTEHGQLNIMYNNAGVTGPATVPEMAKLDLAQFDHVMSINVRGTLAGIKHEARVMGPMGSGSILCTASICGLIGGLGSYAYTISKFTVAAIVKAAAGELGRLGIRVNCISPHVIPTPLVINQFSKIYRGAELEQILDIVSGLGELKGAKCEAVDVARAAVYLSSDDAKFVTGHNLVVDGGFTTFKHLNLPMPGPMH